jgi:putative PIN family toxin of toxin-antitoxin system
MPLERVFVDSNVLISGIVFKGNEGELIRRATGGLIRLVIAEFVLLETRRVLGNKFPQYLPGLDWLLSKIEWELVPEPSPRLLSIAAGVLRDPDDVPVLASILMSKPDVALTGDKDLLTDEVKAVAPMCTCAEYLQRRSESSKADN